MRQGHRSDQDKQAREAGDEEQAAVGNLARVRANASFMSGSSFQSVSTMPLIRGPARTQNHAARARALRRSVLRRRRRGGEASAAPAPDQQKKTALQQEGYFQ